MRSSALSLLALAAACGGAGSSSSSSTRAGAPTTPTRTTAITWSVDDLPGALAAARAKKVPVFVDAWALWCHSCLSMQSYVLKDPALAPMAERYVFAALDTERPGNEAFIVTYPIDNYPTFFILDPDDGSVAGRWVGTMSVTQVRAFLEEGERTVQLAHAGRLAPNDPLARLLAGDRAAIAKQHGQAAQHYAAALEIAPPTWPRRAEALYGQLRETARDGNAARCVDLALGAMGTTGNGPNAADFAAQGVECADDLPETDPRVARVRRAALDRLTALAQDAAAPLSADARGDIWRMVWELREKSGDKAGARAAARSRLTALDEAAAAAPDAQAASTFDWARAESMLYLGQGVDAVLMLQKSEAGLPTDYNPPARLARVYLELGSYNDGLAAADRALERAYGPRKTTILATKADLLVKVGRVADARKAVEEQLAILRALPVRKPASEKAAEEKLQRLK